MIEIIELYKWAIFHSYVKEPEEKLVTNGDMICESIVT